MELQRGIVSSFINFFLTIGRLFQEGLSKTIWWIAVTPGLWLASFSSAKGVFKDETRENKAFACLDLLKPSHNALWKYLTIVFGLQSIAGGIVKRENYYKDLLTWNSQIPIHGYSEDRTTFTIEILGQPTDDDNSRRSWDVTWLTIHKFRGTFQIVSRKPITKHGRKEVGLECVWTSGKDEGKLFLIERTITSLQTPPDEPSAIYSPPILVVLGAEVFLSAGAILAFIQLTKDGWPFLQDLLNSLERWIGQ